ncbi:hypothetical protein TNCV_1262441 [Trichonephila clavipes]|nr:hypothetical protein TNCV_1262441 [Trichonephila clavipes]
MLSIPDIGGYQSPQLILMSSFLPKGRHLSFGQREPVLGFNFFERILAIRDTLGTFHMQYNHTTWQLSIFSIMKIHRLEPGSNPQPWVQNASDKPTTNHNQFTK